MVVGSGRSCRVSVRKRKHLLSFHCWICIRKNELKLTSALPQPLLVNEAPAANGAVGKRATATRFDNAISLYNWMSAILFVLDVALNCECTATRKALFTLPWSMLLEPDNMCRLSGRSPDRQRPVVNTNRRCTMTPEQENLGLPQRVVDIDTWCGNCPSRATAPANKRFSVSSSPIANDPPANSAIKTKYFKFNISISLSN